MKINKDLIISDTNKTLYNVTEDLSTLFNYGEISSVVTSGNNVAIKFTNGIMICHGRHSTGNVACGNAWGGTYASNTINGYTYASAFKTEPAVVLSFTSSGMNGWLMSIGGGSTTQTPTYQLIRGTSATISGYTSYIAIGTWE